mmetsp:Transcript_59244/g.103661  ORF Transcript_59244/g.103661 Transcript_59244/m.103661 type:complete len:227 (-) Transcript_59244:2767-3447(-)
MSAASIVLMASCRGLCNDALQSAAAYLIFWFIGRVPWHASIPAGVKQCLAIAEAHAPHRSDVADGADLAAKAVPSVGTVYLQQADFVCEAGRARAVRQAAPAECTRAADSCNLAPGKEISASGRSADEASVLLAAAGHALGSDSQRSWTRNHVRWPLQCHDAALGTAAPVLLLDRRALQSQHACRDLKMLRSAARRHVSCSSAPTEVVGAACGERKTRPEERLAIG